MAKRKSSQPDDEEVQADLPVEENVLVVDDGIPAGPEIIELPPGESITLDASQLKTGDIAVHADGPNMLPRMPKDPVWVHVEVEHGMLAGKAVYRGERHRVMYYQYEQAHQAQPNGYVLIGE